MSNDRFEVGADKVVRPRKLDNQPRRKRQLRFNPKTPKSRVEDQAQARAHQLANEMVAGLSEDNTVLKEQLRETHDQLQTCQTHVRDAQTLITRLTSEVRQHQNQANSNRSVYRGGVDAIINYLVDSFKDGMVCAAYQDMGDAEGELDQVKLDLEMSRYKQKITRDGSLTSKLLKKVRDLAADRDSDSPAYREDNSVTGKW